MNIRGKGFTLVELMVTVAILIILLAIGVPSMQQFLQNRQALARADNFASTLKFARSEAIKRGKRVAMCRTTTADTVTPNCNTTGTDWATGWLVFEDTAPVDGAYQFQTEILLKVQQAASGQGRLDVPANLAAISFTSDGLALGSRGTFVLSPDSSTTTTAGKRCVVLSTMGRVRTGTMKTVGNETQCDQ
ncbi:GspH/FimT family pseudopilin [Aquabacterium sp.]|uniref:GspH/FimT family pseudopilin n=1 Tax=Aquabacterium sp. TaxID=1872578 RepID=UPI002729AEA9|nr:GspH/FimT family pseudopilin [Aquabacterium sp.]